MNENEINVTTTCIMALANQPNAEEKIKLLLANLFACYPQKDNFDVQSNSNSQTISMSITFTQKEIEKMATTFKKQFIANGLVAHVLKKPCGKNTFSYEIRYRANGFDIRASSTYLQKAKAKFLEKATPKEIQKYKAKDVSCKRNEKYALHVLFNEWLSLKKGTILDKEIKRFETNFNNLPEELRYTPITEIRAVDLDSIMKNVQPRKYEELRTLFNGIFKYATATGVIQNNPVALIKFKRAERQNRECLSEDEIKAFLERIKDVKYNNVRQFAYTLYFFGLRPCEIDEETHREGEFLIARNRKRKNGKIEYKKIPIPTQAQGLIDWDKPLVFNCSDWKRDKLFKELLGNGERTAYYLRHTFSTICQEYLKRPDIVDIWMGDSPQRLVGKVYTHFSDKFMRSQMDMVVFPTLESLET